MYNILLYIIVPTTVILLGFSAIEYFRNINKASLFIAEKSALESKIISLKSEISEIKETYSNHEKEISESHDKIILSLKMKIDRIEFENKELKDELDKFAPGRWRRRLYDKSKNT